MTDVLPPLAGFTIADLAPFVSGGVIPVNASPDHLLMEVGIDNVHGSIKHVLSRVRKSLYFTMFGFADEEIANIILGIMDDKNILSMILLDKSQAAGTHEKKILDHMSTHDPISFNNHVVIGQSETHQILHRKGFVADGIVGCAGSTNLSQGGEGVFVNGNAPGGPNYKAQSNDHMWFTDGASLHTMQTTIISQHQIAARQSGDSSTPKPKLKKVKPT
jgi:hypothetical protein